MSVNNITPRDFRCKVLPHRCTTVVKKVPIGIPLLFHRHKMIVSFFIIHIIVGKINHNIVKVVQYSILAIYLTSQQMFVFYFATTILHTGRPRRTNLVHHCSDSMFFHY